ncbi:DNA-directed RNA polymerase I subunit RPA2-like [Styela clava]
MSRISLESKLPSSTTPSLKNLTVKDFSKLGESQTEALQALTRPHVDSFNWFLNTGIKYSARLIPPIQALVQNRRFSVQFVDATIEKPRVDEGFRNCRTLAVYPSECRQRGSTYHAKLHATFSYSIDGIKQANIPVMLGVIPIMVKSNSCNLSGLTPKQLVAKQEEAEEMGGYFIVNGNEKVLRMLVMQRRNFPLGVVRHSWKNRGPNYTEFGIMMRSVSPDLNVANMVVHYLRNGTVNICIFHRKEMFYIPLIFMLKCLVDKSDVEIYKELTKTKEDDTYFKTCIQNMLRQAKSLNLHLHKDFTKYVGGKFRIKLSQPPWTTDAEITKYLLQHNVLVHLKNNEDKFHLLCHMAQKVFDLAMKKCVPDNLDSVQNQEVLLPGHLYQMVLREKMVLWLLTLSRLIEKQSKLSKNQGLSMLTSSAIQKAMRSVPEVSNAMSYLLATGNVTTKSGLGLQQTTGLAVVADKLNFMRYISHFRCLHRGSFFAEMQTTEVRKLLPESWGFLCPVHTPDGSPCGLMNHLAYMCEVVTNRTSNAAIVPMLYNFGMIGPDSCQVKGPNYYPVLLDGLLVGWLSKKLAKPVADILRTKKSNGEDKIPNTLEICLIERTEKISQFPALFLLTDVARMVRPVLNLETGNVEMIGSFEQPYMDICIIPEEAHEHTTHQELVQNSTLSAVASMTPYSDFNQSPRNMYQCQMGKQTMGTPCQALSYRADNKLYRIQTPQSPMVRPYMYDHFKMDNFPFGTNAVVAVISYTGFDMEDAMILNKASFDRGFAYGSIYKGDLIDLVKIVNDISVKVTFGTLPSDKISAELVKTGKLGADGLPAVGQKLVYGDPYYSYVNAGTKTFHLQVYKGQETAYVDNIKVLSNNIGTGLFKRVYIILRITRNPIIGDKFASRHGQKGICSQLWPAESVPFTESGLFPDIIFNPHGFPSRMTIGMMIESMAGKAAAMHGEPYDATPFSFSENDSAIDHFGKTLRKAGFNYYGTERMYSGVSGLELEADIFIGIVYYQRLRHMVSDKFQVRTTGPVDQMTQQPVQGRKRAGGIRFGEMERDALAAHGCAILNYDRLLLSSDQTWGHLCEKCGSILSPILERDLNKGRLYGLGRKTWKCLTCGSSDNVVLVDIPSVYRYLVNELAAMNIKTVIPSR